MTSTDHFQKLPDFFSSAEECREYKQTNTNPRYKNFNQIYFTAGDVDQFYTYKDQTNGFNPDPNINFDSNVWYQLYKQVKDIKEIRDVVENTDWEKYKNITSEAVDNTFKYIFDKFKKGTFIKIKDNKLVTFLPFSKHDYINEWSDRIKVDPSKFSDIVSFIQYSSKLNGYDISDKKINWKVNTWYGNNCLMRPEFPVGENDRGLSNLKDMLLTLCKERVVPDIEIFINKRDYPLITKSDYEPYEQIYDMENFRLVSHKYNKYAPILSMVTSQKHSDIPMPTHEDWARVSSFENKFFSPECRDYRYNFSKEWSEKIPTAIFRGASTGCGVTIDTNPRLKISYLSTISPTEDGHKFLDAGITKWNLRPRKIMGNPYLQLIIPSTLPFWNKETNGLVQPLSPEKQSHYKYIVNVDGHVNAFRLSLELSMGSVVILADSKYRIWYRRYLVPYVHYVPVKEDLSNLFEQIKWCRDNDKKCEEIAMNAKNFHDTYLSKNGILDYLQYLFFRIKKSTGIYFYNTIKVEDIITNEQEKIIDSYGLLQTNIDTSKISYPFQYEDVNYYSKEGLRLFLSSKYLNDLKDIEDEKIQGEIIHKSHDTTIYKKQVNDNLSFTLKLLDTEDVNRKRQIINEAFCGLTQLNELSKEIPHFRFTYGIAKDSRNKYMLVSEYIEGKTLKDYIIENCTVSELKQIFVMLCLALIVAQEKCGFVHYDLYPWNIVIKKLPKRQKITYQLKTDIITIETDIIPIIIDYGRSHIIYNNKHYGTIEPFKTSRIQDCFCIMVSSLFDMATQQKDKTLFSKELNKAFYIINFYSGTNFQKNQITKYPEMMEFLSKHKKYNEMIFGNKCDLERSKLIYDFFLYLMNCQIKDTKQIIQVKQYSYPDKIDYPFKVSHPLFYYEIISGNNPNISMTKYIEKVEMCFESIMGSATNKLIYTNAANIISEGVIGVLDFIELLKKLNYQEKQWNTYKEPYFMSIDRLTRSCKIILEKIAIRFSERFRNRDDEEFYKPTEEELIIPYFSGTMDFSTAKYTPKTFSIPEEILSILQGNLIININKREKKDSYLMEIKNIMIRNFFYNNRFRLSKDEEKNIILKHKKIMKLSNLTQINYYANIKTLKYISRKLYTQEKEIFLQMNQIPTKIILAIDGILSLS
jgi:hypothetical protein